jgi:large subunit ribosomal protein L25
MTGSNLDVLIHDVSVNPITGEPIHVDFMVIDANKTVEVSIPLEFIGVAPAVKAGLGVLVKVLHEIEVSALPKDLPQSISVDISSLVDLDSQISASEIVLPKGVTLVTKETEIIASVAVMKEDKRNPDNWTKEELDRVVKVFEWLIKEDRKQNPHRYEKSTTLEKGQNDVLK